MVKSYLVVTSPYREPLYNTFIVVRILTAKKQAEEGLTKTKSQNKVHGFETQFQSISPCYKYDI